MKKFIHAIASLVLGYIACGIAAPTMAENGDGYISMLREDRIWEYRVGPTWKYNYDDYITMKIIGTKIINEREYKVFSFERILTLENNEEKTIKSDVFYSGDATKFFLREEVGKVYELTYGDYIFTSDEQLSEMNIPENGAEGNFFNERILYDATTPNGSVVMVAANPFLHVYNMESRPMRQYYGEELNIQGENCTLIGWYFIGDENENDKEEEYPTLENDNYGNNGWIEGIGILDLGILPCFSIARMAGSMPKSSAMDKINNKEPYLYSVYTTDGEVLYGEEPICAGVNALPESQLSLRNADGSILASGVGNVTLTVTGLDGTEVASASGSGEASIPTTSLGRGVYVVTASDGATKRIMKIRL